MVAAETILWLLETNQLLESQSEIAQPAFADIVSTGRISNCNGSSLRRKAFNRGRIDTGEPLFEGRQN
jgi:hypothetical protein